MLFLINLTLVLFFSALILNYLNIQGRVSRLLGMFVVGYAEIVLIEEIAGLFGMLTRSVVFILHVLFALTAYVILKKYGRLEGGWWQGWNPILLPMKNLFNWFKAYPEVAFLTLGVCLIYLFGACRIIVLPPKTSDSLAYHLSRVGYWMQYASFYPWPTENIRQTVFPMNVELGFLWTILGWGTDQLTPFVQWISTIMAVLSIYGVARMMGYSRVASVTTGLLFPTLIQPLLQSTTTQNDMTTAAFWSSVTFFYFLGLRNGRNGDIILSAVAFGLAIGAKSTSLIILPVWGILVLMIYLLGKGKERNRTWQWVMVAVVSTLLWGSYIYIQNYIAYGSALGPPENTERVTADNEEGITFRLELLRDNAARYFYQMVDFSPLPESIAEPLNRFKQKTFGFVFEVLRLPVDNVTTLQRGKDFQLSYFNEVSEDNSWFGPLIIFQVIAVLGLAVKWRKSHDWWMRVSPFLFLGGFFILHSAAQLWTYAKGRYYILPVTLSFPALAFLLSFKSGKVERFARVFMIVIGLLPAYVAVSGNWTWNMISDALSFHRRAPAWENIAAYKYVSRNIFDSSIGLLGNQGGFRDYPLFGMAFTNNVNQFPLDNERLHYLPGNSRDDYLRRFQESDYLFLSKEKKKANKNAISEDFHIILEAGPYSVWTRSERFSTLNSCLSPQWPLSELFLISPQLNCLVWPQYPLLSSSTNGFFLTNDPDGSFQVHLFSLNETRVLIVLDLLPLMKRTYEVDIRFLQNGKKYYSRRLGTDLASLQLEVELPQGDTLLDLRLVLPSQLQDSNNPVPLVSIKRININLP